MTRLVLANLGFAQVVLGVIFAIAGLWSVHYTLKREALGDISASGLPLFAAIFILVGGSVMTILGALPLVFP